MYEIKVLLDFSGAHNLRQYKGKCEDLHGHNWKIETVVAIEALNQSGMVMDFKDLKAGLQQILEIMDHKYLNDLPFFQEHNPTSENIARFIYEKLSEQKIIDRGQLLRVTVWETDTSAASYYEK